MEFTIAFFGVVGNSGRGLPFCGRHHPHGQHRRDLTMIGNVRRAAAFTLSECDRYIFDDPRTDRADAPRCMGGFVLCSDVERVDADFVGVHIEVVAGCQFSNRDRCGALVLRVQLLELVLPFAFRVVVSVGLPQIDLKGDRVVEKGVVRHDPERFKGAECVSSLGSGDAAGDIAKF